MVITATSTKIGRAAHHFNVIEKELIAGECRNTEFASRDPRYSHRVPCKGLGKCVNPAWRERVLLLSRSFLDGKYHA